MADVLKTLKQPWHIDGGSDLGIVTGQFLEPLHEFGFRGAFDAFLCNGAIRYRCTFDSTLDVVPVRDFSIRDDLGADRFEQLVATIQAMLDSPEFGLPEDVPIIGERIIDRVSMLNVAPGGRPSGNLSDAAFAARERFVEHDETTGYRARFLDELRARTADLSATSTLDMCLGGQTSFDIGIAGNDKSFALSALLGEGVERITYFGDALFEGGNDEPILKFVDRWEAGQGPCPVIPVAVDRWEDTAAWLRANT